MQEGFRYYKFDEGLNHEEELVKDCILFVLKGSLQFSCNGFQFTVSSGEMVFFCRDSLFNTQSLEKCEVVAALFEGGSMALSKGLLFRVIPPEGNCRILYGTSCNQGSVMQISWTTGVLSGRWSELYPFSRNKTQGTFLEHSLLLFQTGTREFFLYDYRPFARLQKQGLEQLQKLQDRKRTRIGLWYLPFRLQKTVFRGVWRGSSRMDAETVVGRNQIQTFSYRPAVGNHCQWTGVFLSCTLLQILQKMSGMFSQRVKTADKRRLNNLWRGDR